MGEKEAVKNENNEDLENLEESEDLEAQDLEEGEEEAAEEESQDKSEEGGSNTDENEEVENEIVLEGETQTPDQVPAGIYKRINKLNGKVQEAKAEATESSQENANLKEEIKVLRMALEQKKGGATKEEELVRPNPDDFEAGTYDPKYIEAVDEYQDKRLEIQANKLLSKQSEKSQVTEAKKADDAELLEKQKAHIGRAMQLNVRDYEETEDKAIAILGNDSVNHLIRGLDTDTEKILYHLGKNPKKAERYAEMFKTRNGTIKALVELGGLVTKIKVKPKATTPPGTDDELEGGGSNSSGKKNASNPHGATFE